MSAPDPGERPRPQYGEYASAQEQRARIQQPMHPEPAAVPPPAEPAVVPSPAEPGSRPGRPADRIVTIALLAYGAINVALSAPSFVDLAALADATYKMMGIPGSFAETGTTRGWGIAGAVLLVAGFLVTAALAVRAIRRRRASWWIPVVGAVVTYAIVSVCLAVPLMNDPAFVAYLHAR